MQHQSDAQLLVRYAHQGSEAAFDEIVARHADIVYSAALRQTDLPEVAHDVAQTVFIDLARKARQLAQKLAPNASLVGWLYRSTRFAALSAMRSDQRRQARERQAMDRMETVIPTSEAQLDWEQVRPLLDEAISKLAEEERDALLLRFFKGQDFRAVGLALGVSDDAAQKRVSRALAKLRDLLARRGIRATATALSVALPANAVQSAPVGLAAALSSAAIAASPVLPTAFAATKIIAMTTMQKTIIGAALAVAIGAGIHEANRASRLSEQVQALRQQKAPLVEQIQELQQERDSANSRLMSLAAELSALRSNSNDLLKRRSEIAGLKRDSHELAQLKAAAAEKENDPTTTLARTWAERVTLLKQRLQQNPNESIPELQFTSGVHWLNSVQFPLAAESDVQRALTLLRQQAVSAFSVLVKDALNKFSQANAGGFPSDVSQLQPYCDQSVGDTLVQLYEVAPASVAKGTQVPPQVQGDSIIRRRVWPNPDSNSRLAVFLGGTTWYTSDTHD